MIAEGLRKRSDLGDDDYPSAFPHRGTRLEESKTLKRPGIASAIIRDSLLP